jgi:hypothetical protein
MADNRRISRSLSPNAARGEGVAERAMYPCGARSGGLTKAAKASSEGHSIFAAVKRNLKWKVQGD